MKESTEIHAATTGVYPFKASGVCTRGGATYPQLYQDVRAEMGGRWVCFQPNVEQPGFSIWGCLRALLGRMRFEAFLVTMGVFSVVPDPTRMDVFSGVER